MSILVGIIIDIIVAIQRMWALVCTSPAALISTRHLRAPPDST